MAYENAKRTATVADFRYPGGEWGPLWGKMVPQGASPPASDFVLAVPMPGTMHYERVWSAVGLQTSESRHSRCVLCMSVKCQEQSSPSFNVDGSHADKAPAEINQMKARFLPKVDLLIDCVCSALEHLNEESPLAQCLTRKPRTHDSPFRRHSGR
jgi:hypothetical protein